MPDEIRAGDGTVIYRSPNIADPGRLADLRVLLETAARHDTEARDGARGWREREVVIDATTHRTTFVPDDPRQVTARAASDAALAAFAHNALEQAEAVAWNLPAHGQDRSDAANLAESWGRVEGVRSTVELLDEQITHLLEGGHDAVPVERVRRWLRTIEAAQRGSAPYLPDRADLDEGPDF